MKTLLPSLLAAGALLATPAHAQRAFQVGPTVGATLSTAHFDHVTDYTSTPLRGGFTAGLIGSYQSAGHWGAQVAGLFVQQGYTQHYESPYSHYEYLDRVRLNYLRLPLLATFSQYASGQGLRLFAGPYLGVLLGGRRTYDTDYVTNGFHQEARVLAGDFYTRPAIVLYDNVASLYAPDYTYYSRRFDVGLQGGVGYRVGNALLQVGYTLGLRNLAATTVYDMGTTSYSAIGEPYRTRGWQASLTYLLGPKF